MTCCCKGSRGLVWIFVVSAALRSGAAFAKADSSCAEALARSQAAGLNTGPKFLLGSQADQTALNTLFESQYRQKVLLGVEGSARSQTPEHFTAQVGRRLDKEIGAFELQKARLTKQAEAARYFVKTDLREITKIVSNYENRAARGKLSAASAVAEAADLGSNLNTLFGDTRGLDELHGLILSELKSPAGPDWNKLQRAAEVARLHQLDLDDMAKARLAQSAHNPDVEQLKPAQVRPAYENITHRFESDAELARQKVDFLKARRGPAGPSSVKPYLTDVKDVLANRAAFDASSAALEREVQRLNLNPRMKVRAAALNGLSFEDLKNAGVVTEGERADVERWLSEGEDSYENIVRKLRFRPLATLGAAGVGLGLFGVRSASSAQGATGPISTEQLDEVAGPDQLGAGRKSSHAAPTTAPSP